MKIYTIPQKMSGTGTIHDIAREHFDREIKFRAGTRYAVVNAACYGGKGYTTHQTAEAAVRASETRGYSHSVIDCDGNLYRVDDNSRLQREDR